LPASVPALPTDTELRGDVNRDGAVNATDISLTSRRVRMSAPAPTWA